MTVSAEQAVTLRHTVEDGEYASTSEIDYIALDDPRRATSFIAEIEAGIEKIAAQPGRARDLQRALDLNS